MDGTIHFLSAFHRWLAAGHDRATAVAMVFTHTGPALLVTGATGRPRTDKQEQWR
ncbi:MAG: hypothetical protein GY856_52465 [bacterium]|nr:hypothetical protein [bacterium]